MARMTAGQRRAQLLSVAKSVFADLGYDGATVEEIATRAGVSKPVVYEHFGGKEGIYAVVVDREASALLDHLTSSIEGRTGGRETVHASARGFLEFIDSNPEGFRVLTRDTPSSIAGPGMAGLLSDVAAKASGVLERFFEHSSIDPAWAPLYAGGLVGMVAYIGSWWATEAKDDLDAEDVAAHITALAYFGLRDLPSHPGKALALPARKHLG